MASSSNNVNEKDLNVISSDFIDPLQCVKKEWVKFGDDENDHSTSSTNNNQPEIKSSQLSTVDLPRQKNEQVGFGNLKRIVWKILNLFCHNNN